MDGLEAFIVRAKAAAYVGDGRAVEPSRPGAHDLVYAQDGYSYRDSYFGGTAFVGQEVVWLDDAPVWAMNYHGSVLDPELIDAAEAGQIIRRALSQLYAAGRFLGGWRWSDGAGRVYVDESDGDVGSFTGRERIEVGDRIVYRLDYHGGLVTP
ncbi:MAG: DUF5680 domain-containing protein [Propionibacteriaceae bacterium]|jgi:hypothetical protein|nr:DUF5680 domain-containing protein [Propionibacteriaceae bacterium]